MRPWWLLVPLLGGCFPGMSVRGRVHEAPEPCKARGVVLEPGAPIERAAVTVVCPGDEAPVMKAESDARGRFAVSNGDVMDMACAVHVEKPGYLPRTFSVADLCAVSASFDGCHALSLHAELKKAE